MDIYLDYAATAPLCGEALSAMMPYLTDNFGNPDSLHSFGRRAAFAVAEARAKVAETLGAQPSEVCFTSGGTEADNWAVRFLGTGEALVSAVEHAAVLSAASLREGGHAVFPVRGNGVCAAEDVELQQNTGLVCLMAVNNETGSIQPAEEVAALAHAHGALFFCDCVQAAASLDLKELYRFSDAVSLSAHKVGGPKGMGALVVKKGIPLPPLIAGGEQERGLRGGTSNVAGIVGFAEALSLAQRRREEFCAHTRAMRDLFERELLSRLGAKTDGENRAPNISHVTFERGGEALLNLLDLHGLSASGGAACSAHAALPSHVLLAMGRSPEEAKRGIRFSFGRETTEEEVRAAVRIVLSCLGAEL